MYPCLWANRQREDLHNGSVEHRIARDLFDVAIKYWQASSVRRKGRIVGDADGSGVFDSASPFLSCWVGVHGPCGDLVQR